MKQDEKAIEELTSKLEKLNVEETKDKAEPKGKEDTVKRPRKGKKPKKEEKKPKDEEDWEDIDDPSAVKLSELLSELTINEDDK